MKLTSPADNSSAGQKNQSSYRNRNDNDQYNELEKKPSSLNKEKWTQLNSINKKYPFCICHRHKDMDIL
jgi:hypothetical protein